MKIRLNVPERLLLLGILPEKGSFLTIKMVNDIVNKVGLSAKEIEEYGVKQEGNRIYWNSKGNEEKEIEFEREEIKIISDKLKEMDKKEELSVKYYTLYKKFVLDII